MGLLRACVFVVIVFLCAKWMMRWTDMKVQAAAAAAENENTHVGDDTAEEGGDGMEVFTREWWRARLGYLFDAA